jgi:RNA polymerase sigma-70 factor (sigma-E family)
VAPGRASSGCPVSGERYDTGEAELRFREFVRAQWTPLTRTAYLLTGDRGTAEDLAQAALEKVHRRWNRVRSVENPAAYARRTLVNTAISWRRRRRVAEVPLLATDAATVPDAYDRVADRDVVLAALRGLPKRTRAVLVLRYYEDLSEADTAEVLHCSLGTVKSLASRGLARLRQQLAPPLAPTDRPSFQEDRV